VLLSAVELGLFTELAKGPMPYETLRAHFQLHPRSARDFFDALVALGMLEREGQVYRNTPQTDRFLDRAKPTYVGGILEMVNARLFGFWNSLTEGLHTGQPQNEVKGGKDLFGELYKNEARLRQFLGGMTGLSLGAAQVMAQRFPWRDYQTVIDIGCAQGAMPVQIALAHPHLRGGGADLPVVKPIFLDYVRANGLADRLTFHPLDFFTQPLPRADVLIMGHILHDWDLEQKRMLLRKAYEALPKGGALIVFDAVIDDERRRNAFGLLMSLNMLIETPGGFDYTGADCQTWMREAGFRDTRVEPLLGPDSMVIGLK
jgi:cyclopropane fatty-acyl-phospholipid synthase-like methyltransferase